ncbi:hypothetical protein RI138_22500 [Streptomyces sp. C11-1]|uniref:Uncharacterized protein n=1 Tax=Streptomyces durocortorensis TaxID=2811104 RepID=A0ABY9W0M9_9ACTN|nr:hypothetical protein [Streptomyces durocortorensis]WNF29370.1 hypothetical protein RI138_22500 [Streptomyces durocortorensis]
MHADEGVGVPSKNDEVRSLPYWLTLAVSLGVVFIGGQFFGFPWWLRLITVVAVTCLLEGVNQAVGRARAKKGRH